MSVRELLAKLNEKDVKLTIEGNNLNIDAPKGAITSDLQGALKIYKSDIIKLLKSSNPIKSQPLLRKINRGGTAPLSLTQQGLWFINQFEGGVDTQYNMPWSFRLRGKINIQALNYTFNKIIERHEVLRTTFHEIDDEAVQVITDTLILDIPIIEVAEAWIDRSVEEHAKHVFDLSKGPLIKVSLLRISPNEHMLLLNMHHVISDGWSIDILNRELGVFYKGYIAGEKSPLSSFDFQYADFAYWQREYLQGDALEKKVDYWKSKLIGAPVLLDLPTDRPRPAQQSFRGASETFKISKFLTEQLNVLSRRENTTLFVTLMAVFKVLLYRYSGQTDICVGAPFANRQQLEFEGLVGFFLNTIVIRSQVNGELSFSNFLRQLNQDSLSAHDYQEVPFEYVVEALSPERNLSHSPIFQVMFVLQNASGNGLDLPGITSMPYEINAYTSKFDLTMELTESSIGIEGILEYSTDLYNPETIKQLITHYQILLEGIINDSNQAIGSLPILNGSEKQVILYDWNATIVSYPQDQCLHQLFEAQAEKTPNAIAVIYQDQRFTYEQLNHRSNQLAHYLIEKGVGPETKVGLYVERSLEMVIGILGIQKAGGAYVPIDPEYPRQRVAHVLGDSGVDVVLTQEKFHEQLLQFEWQHTVFRLDSEWEVIAQYNVLNPNVTIEPSNLAYVIYTSGSTGKPKGVMITHASLLNHMLWMQREFDFSSNDIIFQKTPLSFDASVCEWALSLITGAKLVLANADGHRDPDYLIELIEQYQITVFVAVPSMLKLLLNHEHSNKLQSLRYLISGGEALPRSTCEKFTELNLPAKLCNFYGPTETTVDSHFWTFNNTLQQETVPIGRPVDNTQSYILDDKLSPVPVGVAGELYIGGKGLARGYQARPDLTAEYFIPDVFSQMPGNRLYRTRDRVRYLAGGNIEYIGRTDHQVKVRGFRIELGEIESALSVLSDIKEAVVLTHSREDTGSLYLVAYVVFCDVSAFSQSQLKTLLQKKLKETLPDYMVPSLFVVLDDLPLTPSGKIDRKSLPDPDMDALQIKEYVAPETDIEKNLVKIWEKILKFPSGKIGIYDDFFDLGGHSLLATQVVSHTRKMFDAKIQIRDLFSATTVQSLALVINDSINNKSLINDKAFPLIPAKRTSSLPLSFAQQRLWFLNQLDGEKDISYNMPWALRLTGKLNIKALKNAFQALIKRHESLRTTFHTSDDGSVQRIVHELFLDIPLLDITAAWVSHYIEENAKHVFNLSEGPLIKASLLRILPNEHVLLINIHHIIFDGWSMGIFNHEMTVLYEAFKKGKESPLSPLPIQYADFACWQRQWLQGEVLEQQLNYWTTQLQDAPGLLELPTDRPRPAIQSYRGDAENFIIPKALTDRLNILGRECNATLFMVLMAAFKVLLHRYSGVKDLCVGTVVANRQRQELEGLIGFFVNTLVLRNHIVEASSFKDFLQQVKATALSAYAHQDVPFEYLVDELNPERNLSYMPLAQVVLVLQNATQEALVLPGLTVSIIEEETLTAKFDLIMDLMETSEGIVGRLEYSKDLFDKGTIKRFVVHFQRLLEGVAEQPEQSMFKLPLLSEPEYQQQLIESNGNGFVCQASQSITQFFEQQVENSPKAIAVVFEAEQLTYEELNNRSNQLAHYLIEQGVGPETRVGLSVNRSLEMIVAILGIVKAGGAYVPVDPDNPTERINYILEDSHISLLLTQASVKDKSLKDQAVSSICLDRDWSAISQCSTETPSIIISPKNLAYVIYTSGSTGRPKGTLITHANVVRLFTATQDQYQFNENDVWTLFHSFAFDFSVWEIWGALFYGGKVVVVPYWVTREPERFCQLVHDEGITVLNQTPSAFNQFIATDRVLGLDRSTLKLRYVIFGGEALGMQSLQPWFDRHGDQQPQLINMYGITETTVHVTHYPVNKINSQGASSTIGKQLSDLQAYILDNHLQIAPIGVPGELYVGGGGVARGYHGRPDLTAERFIPHPFSKTPGAHLYKTGDLVRFQGDGNIEYLGRIDQQVKVRGFRIELGEIQSRLLEHPAVQDSVVLVREDQPGDKRLVAYLVPDSNYELPQTETNQLTTEAVTQWKDVFENNYSATTAEDPFQDFTGWNDSYDGKPIPEDQMREWADNTAESILALQPKNILEIACGTGLLTGRLVPHCESYVGTDFSPTVLQQLRNKLPQLGEHAKKVHLVAGPADDLSELAGQTFDTIILNSVVQYFPDLDYLLTALEQAQTLLSPGGHIFVGDIRHLGLIDAFHTSIQSYKTKGDFRTPGELRRLVQYHAANDNELVIAPEFFHALKAQSSTISHVQVIPKMGDYQNELGAYRFDVVLHTAKDIAVNKELPWQDWKESHYSLEQAKSHLSLTKPDIFALTRVPNRRVTRDVQTFSLCNTGEEGINSISDINEQIDKTSEEGIATYELKQLAESLSYNIEFSWLGGSSDGSFDVVFYRQSSTQFPPLNVFPYDESLLKTVAYQSLANNPRFQDLKRELLRRLRDYLQECLPDYMVPSSFVFLENLPLTANGKVDKKALPVPDVIALQTQDYVAPATDIERKLVEVWADVLGLEDDKLGTQTNFFELGGDSILSLQIVARSRRLGLHITPKQLFEHRTIIELSKVVATDTKVEAEQGQVCGEFPFIPIQHWFFEQELTDSHHYNQEYLLEVPETLQKTILLRTIEALMIHHDALRLRFKKSNNGHWAQSLNKWDAEVDISQFDLSELEPDLQLATLDEESSKIQGQLNIEQGPLLQIGWFHLGKGKSGRLLITIHHLAVDGVSWRILLEDFKTVYRQLEAGEPVQLPPKTSSYKSWSEHLQPYVQSEAMLVELDYWHQLSRHKLIPIPQDKQCKASQNTMASSRTCIVSLDKKATQALLQEVPAAYNTQINDVLLTALLQAFNQWTGGEELLFNLEGHGREDLFEDIDLSRTVGWFTTIYPVLLTRDSNNDFGTVLKSVKEQLRLIPKRGIGYSLLRYCSRDPIVEKVINSVPVPQVRFNYLGQLDQMARGKEFLRLAKEPSGKYCSPRQIRPLLIDINSMVINECMEFHIGYSTALHNEQTIKLVGGYLIDNLQKLIAHCISSGSGGYTPSDFPEAALNLDELDALLGSLETENE